MKNIARMTGLALALVGGTAAAEQTASERTANRIENRADRAAESVDAKARVAKERIDETAEAKKERIERSAAAGRDGVDRSVDVDERSVRVGENVDDDRNRSSDGRRAVSRRDRSAKVKQDVGDAWVTTKVKAELFGDKELRGSEIDVDTDKAGVVTLRGTVPSLAAKEHAVSEVKTIEGVRKVNDRLKVSADVDTNVKVDGR